MLEVCGKPGDKTEMHSHPALVAIAITDGKYRFTSPDGQTTEAELKAGQAMYFNAMEHAGEFTGTTEAWMPKIIAVNSKPANKVQRTTL